MQCSAMVEDDLETLWRVHKTIMEMLKDRGYVISDDELTISIVDFKDQYKGMHRQELLILAAKESDPADQIFVFFPDETKIGVKAIKWICQHMQVKENQLIFNVTKHELVPKHVLLTDDEKREMLTRYKLKDSQLPCIQVTDPIARYYGLKKGQVSLTHTANLI